MQHPMLTKDTDQALQEAKRRVYANKQALATGSALTGVQVLQQQVQKRKDEGGGGRKVVENPYLNPADRVYSVDNPVPFRHHRTLKFAEPGKVILPLAAGTTNAIFASTVCTNTTIVHCPCGAGARQGKDGPA